MAFVCRDDYREFELFGGCESSFSSINLNRSIELHLTTEPPIFLRCCCVQSFFHTIIILSLFTKNHKQNSCDTNEHRIDIKRSDINLFFYQQYQRNYWK